MSHSSNNLEQEYAYELAASLKPFSIAGIKFDGIACPTIMFSNSNLVVDPGGSGSIYLPLQINKSDVETTTSLHPNNT